MKININDLVKGKEITIECNLLESKSIMSDLFGKAQVEKRKYRKRARKPVMVRTCKICGDVLGFHKKNLCGKPACKKEAGRQRCLKYASKRHMEWGKALGNTRAVKKIFVPVSRV
jgi:hypothetical protein